MALAQEVTVEEPISYEEFESMLNANNVYSENFALSTISAQEGSCQCAITVDRAVLMNTGNIDSAYRLSVTGDDARYVELSEDQIMLNSGESEEIDVFISSPCKRDSLEFNIEVDTVIGSHKSYKRDLDLLECNNIGAGFIGDNSYQNKPCRAIEYTFEVANTGTFVDDFSFDIEGMDRSNVRLLADEVTLKPSESVYVTMFVQFDCSVYGTYEGQVVVTSEKADATSRLPFLATIARDYDFIARSGVYRTEDKEKIPDFSEDIEEYKVCAGRDYRLPIEIENLAEVDNDFKVTERSEIGFISKSIELLSINATSAQYFDLNVTPGFDDTGIHNYTLMIESDKGDLILEKQIGMDVIDCDSFTMQVQEYDKVCVGENEYDLYLTNTGEKENTISVKSDNALMNLDTAVDVEPNQTVAITFAIDSSDTAKESENFRITASVDINPQRNITKDLFVDFVSDEKCHEARITGNLGTVYFEEEMKDLIIKNTGFKASNYDLSLIAPSWMSLANDTVFLGPGEEKDIPVYFRPCSRYDEGKFAVSIEAKADNNATYAFDTTVKLKDKSLFDRVMIFMDDYKLAFIFIVVIIFVALLLLFLVFNKNSLTAIIVVLLVVFLIFGAAAIAYMDMVSDTPDTRMIEKEVESLTDDAEVCFVDYQDNVMEFDLTAHEKTDAIIDLGNVTCPNGTFAKQAGENYTEIQAPCSNSLIVFENLQGRYDMRLTFEEPEEQIADETQEPIDEAIDEDDDAPENDTQTNESEVIVEKVIVEMTAEEQLYQYVVNNNLTDSPEYQIWNKNTKHRIDLDELFNDPDKGDVLTYSATKPRHINLTIDDGVVTLVPEKDWSGVSYITFKARDQEGAESVSPEIALIVRDKETFTVERVKQFINDNVLYVIAATVILILLVIILVLGRKPKKNDKNSRSSSKDTGNQAAGTEAKK